MNFTPPKGCDYVRSDCVEFNMNKTNIPTAPTTTTPKMINDNIGENSQSNNSSSKSSSNKLLAIVESGSINPSIVNNDNDGEEDSTMAVSNQSSDYVDESYDTFGLHVDMEPNRGGIKPNSAQSIGGISAITTPEMMPVNHIKIPLPIVEEVLKSSFNASNPTTSGDVVGGESTTSTNTSTGDSNKTVIPNNIISQEVRKKRAERHLQDGMKALENSNFEFAADNFKEGYSLLVGDNSWEQGDDYTTILQLCSEGSHAAYIIGDFDTMNVLIDEVLKQDISVEEKFRVYECKMLALQAVDDNHASLSLGIDVRRQLGFYTPPDKAVSNVTNLVGYMRTRRLLGNKTPEDLANLPKLTNKRVVMAQRVLELIGFDCWTAQPTLFPLIVYLNVKETIEYGINPATSCNAFLGYGILLCGVFGDPQRGQEMALASALILAKDPLPKVESRCTFIVQGCISHWTSPLKDTIAPLLKGYQMGLEYGDIQSTGLNQTLLISHTYNSGRPLEEMYEYIALNVGLQNEYMTIAGSSGALQTHFAHEIQICHLLFMNLRGIELEENEETNFDVILKFARKTNNKGLRSHLLAAQLELKVFFSEWETAADLLQEAPKDIYSDLVAIANGVRLTVLEALVCLKAAQSSSAGMIARWKWKKRGIRVMKIIRGWVELGNPNVIHILHLLEAELAILNRYDRLAEDSFQLAINTASANGFLHDLALSHELVSSYLTNRGDRSQGAYHMEQAIRYYSEWGATAKVDQLKKRLAV